MMEGAERDLLLEAFFFLVVCFKVDSLLFSAILSASITLLSFFQDFLSALSFSYIKSVSYLLQSNSCIVVSSSELHFSHFWFCLKLFLVIPVSIMNDILAFS